MEAIGLDVGHSMVKVSVGTEPDNRMMFASAAAPAVELTFEATARAAQRETVRLSSGLSMFVGDTALIQRGKVLFDGLTDDWVETDEHAALLVAGHLRAIELGAKDDAMVVLGLPSKTYAEHKVSLQSMAALQLQKPKAQIVCLPQPYAALMESVLDENGVPTREIDNSTWVVIDIGFYTTDYGALQRGTWKQEATASSAGVHRAAQMMIDRLRDNHKIDLSDIRKGEQVVRTKNYRYRGETIDMAQDVADSAAELAADIIKHANKVFGGGTLDEAEGVLVVGGGANLVFEHLKKEWRHAQMPHNPRMCVAEGLRRFGMGQVAMKKL